MEDQFVYQDPRNKHQPRRPHNRKACVRCQSRKKKCDGKRPCEGCIKANSECRYAKQQADDNLAFIPFEGVAEGHSSSYAYNDSYGEDLHQSCHSQTSPITWSNTFSPSPPPFSSVPPASPPPGSSSSSSSARYYNRANSYHASSPSMSSQSMGSTSAAAFTSGIPSYSVSHSPSSRKRSWTDGGYGGHHRALPHDLVKSTSTSLPPISDLARSPPTTPLPSISAFDTMAAIEDSSSVLRRLSMD